VPTRESAEDDGIRLIGARNTWKGERFAPVPERSISRRLSEFTATLDFAAIPEAVRTQGKHLMLDAVGLALASAGYDFARRSLAGILRAAGVGPYVVIGTTARVPLRDAVFLNGILVHGLDFDDTHLSGIIHATASIFPAAHGVASQLHSSGREFLTAYVAGMECATRIAASANGQLHRAGFHPTGVVGVFGCALASGRLYGLSEEALTMAQGIALSFASGSLEFVEDGAWTKRLHPGHAAACGITAAALAEQGFTGPARAYEGRYGLFNSYLGTGAESADLSFITKTLGEKWEIPAVAVKPYPACHFVHSTVDATLLLLGRHGFTAAQVRSVTVHLPREVIPIVCEPEAAKKRPSNGYDAKFSIPYVVAAAIVFEKLGIREFDDDNIGDERVLSLAERVDCVVDPRSGFPRHYSAEVVITLMDGSLLSHREQVNRGCEDRPLSNADIVRKYMDNATTTVSNARAEHIRDVILDIDRVNDLSALSDLLVG